MDKGTTREKRPLARDQRTVYGRLNRVEDTLPSASRASFPHETLKSLYRALRRTYCVRGERSLAKLHGSKGKARCNTQTSLHDPTGSVESSKEVSREKFAHSQKKSLISQSYTEHHSNRLTL